MCFFIILLKSLVCIFCIITLSALSLILINYRFNILNWSDLINFLSIEKSEEKKIFWSFSLCWFLCACQQMAALAHALPASTRCRGHATVLRRPGEGSPHKFFWGCSPKYLVQLLRVRLARGKGWSSISTSAKWNPKPQRFERDLCSLHSSGAITEI